MASNRFDELGLEFANGISRRTVLKGLVAVFLNSFLNPFFGTTVARGAIGCFTPAVQNCRRVADQKFEKELSDCEEQLHLILP
jgi:hypothetical protein